MTAPYWSGHGVDVYLADYRDVLPTLAHRGVRADSVVTDPPYGVTGMAWDRWVTGWPQHMAQVSDSLWSFLPMRAVLERAAEFDGWRYAQDVVWEKANGSGLARDRFRRVHEHAVHWYRGAWGAQHRSVPRVPRTGAAVNVTPRQGNRDGNRAQHLGDFDAMPYADDGTRLVRSVLRAPAVRFGKRHPTEKPQAILRPLVEFSVPPGGLVLDPFAGSLSTARAAVALGRRAVVIERHEPYAEAGVQALQAAIAEGTAA